MTQQKHHVMLGFETELRLLHKIALTVENLVASCLDLLGTSGLGRSHLLDGKKPTNGQ
ncbi:MAG: hypothetical protein KA175_02320 [Flavobacteriales bacterium]|nr:hypothetical protein [Flavobacteriales bacterium]MBP6696423.1 hypothetical protein [Flavobacteriales bacterium]